MLAQFRVLRVRVVQLLGALLFACLYVNAQAMTISPSPSITGNYTVTWGAGCQATGYPYPYPPYVCTYLSENGSNVGGVSPFPRSGMAPGTYNYTVVQDWIWYQTTVDSGSVVVGTPPPLDPLLTQRNYQYQTRVGDINADGRQDLLIQRISGGVANNGVLQNLIVQQTATSGQYTLIAPSSAQLATASGWPVSSAVVAVEDVNMDGFVDVTVKGVANALGVPGAKNFMVYSPGQAFSSIPKGIRLLDDSVLKFVGNVLDYHANPNYFTDYAPMVYFYGSS